MQKPQPAPQPLPPPDKPVPQPEQRQNEAAPPSPSAPSSQKQPKSFVGRIVKESGDYVLQVAAGTTYRLSNEGDVNQFENKNVKVLGELDSSNTIRVASIVPLS